MFIHSFVYHESVLAFRFFCFRDLASHRNYLLSFIYLHVEIPLLSDMPLFSSRLGSARLVHFFPLSLFPHLIRGYISGISEQRETKRKKEKYVYEMEVCM